MKKMLISLVAILILFANTVLAEDESFIGRWNEDSEMGSSIILKSDGSCEGTLMFFYEFKGSYEAIDNRTAVLHVESVDFTSGFGSLINSDNSSMNSLLQEQLDGLELVLTDEGTLLFNNMVLYRDDSYREAVVINDGKLDGQWELDGHADALDQTVFYFTPDGIVYTADEGMITPKPYSFDGNTVVMGDENILTAVLQEDGTLNVEFAGTFVKTSAYAEHNFSDIAGVYGEEQDGYISGYYLTTEGKLLNINGIPGVALQWDTHASELVMAGNRIGVHDELGNRFFAMVRYCRQ